MAWDKKERRQVPMDVLQNTLTIASFGVACIGCVIGFVLCRGAVGGKYLDQVCSLKKAQEIVDGLSQGQAKKHLLVTCCLDTAFPVCYGLFLAGLALRVSPLHGVPSVLPALFAVLSDFCENATHVLAIKNGKVPRLKPLFSILKCIFLSVALWLLLLSFLGITFCSTGLATTL